MAFLILKYALSAAAVVAASEIAKRSDRLGALVLALPLMTILTLFWLHAEAQGNTKIANHAWYTFWYVLPTLPMFLAFPWLLHRWGFYPAMLGLAGGTVIIFALFAFMLRRFGIALW